MEYKIEIQELPEIKLVGITHIGEFEKTPVVYEQLMKWAFEKGLLNTPNVKTATIYHDNPRVTQMSKVRWSACLVIDNKVETEGEIRKISICKGKYAIGHFEIEPALFEKAWETALVWVKDNGYEFGEYDYFELYHGDFQSHPEHKFIVDICIPVK